MNYKFLLLFVPMPSQSQWLLVLVYKLLAVGSLLAYRSCAFLLHPPIAQCFAGKYKQNAETREATL